jgi:hypothetical protein
MACRAKDSWSPWAASKVGLPPLMSPRNGSLRPPALVSLSPSLLQPFSSLVAR